MTASSSVETHSHNVSLTNQKPSRKEVAHMQRLVQPIPGYADYTEAQNALFSSWKTKLSEVYAQHGFTGFNSRPVEFWDNLRKDGTLQQVFRVCRDDGSLTDLGLPFDRTVSLALYVAKYGKEIAFPFKRQDISISHRGEHPSPGRFRGFIQADVDIISSKLTTTDDIECLATLMDGLNALGIEKTMMYLNHIELPKAMIRSLNVSEEFIGQILRIIDKLDKKSPSEVFDEVMELQPQINRETLFEMIKVFKFSGSIAEFKVDPNWGPAAETALRELQETFSLLPSYGISMEKVSFCPGMVRGLAYYTGLVFETFLTDYPELGSIASGGRYVNLVGNFNPAFKHIGGVGGAIGLTRLFDIVTRKNMVIPTTRSVANVCIACLRKEELSKAIEIATSLRESGITVDLYTDHKAKGFFNYSNKKGIPYCILVSSDNIAVKDMLLKDVSSSKQQDFGNNEDAINFLLDVLKK